MQISYSSSSEVIIKTKTENVVLGNGVKIGNHKIDGQGEYDVASIQCEGHAFDHGIAYFIRNEELFITYLTTASKESVGLDDISNTDVLVTDIRSDDSADSVRLLIKSLEPSYVFLIGAGATDKLIAELNLPVSENSVLKLTKLGLPEEGTFIIPNK